MRGAECIRSPHNPQVKEWAALATKKGRDRSGAFLVEGAHLVGEALRSECAVMQIIYVPGTAAEREVTAEWGRRSGGDDAAVRRQPVTEEVMRKISDTGAPQGVAAVVRRRDVSGSELFRPAGRPLVAVDAVRDPGNAGTIIRAADAAGAAGALLGEGSVDMYNPKTVRATMGSLFHLPVLSCDLAVALPRARAAGFRVVAASLNASRHCFETDLTGPVCLLLGNEAEGISPELEAFADVAVTIPIVGRAESLNVAMAATVLLYEALRQRHSR